MGRLQRVLIVCAVCLGLCTIFAFLNFYGIGISMGRGLPIFQDAGLTAFEANIRPTPEQWDQLAAIVHEPPLGSKSPGETSQEYYARVARKYYWPVVDGAWRQISRSVIARSQTWNLILVLALGALTIMLAICAVKADEWD